MLKINIIYDSSLNAFASGINERTYTVTLSSRKVSSKNWMMKNWSSDCAWAKSYPQPWRALADNIHRLCRYLLPCWQKSHYIPSRTYVYAATAKVVAVFFFSFYSALVIAAIGYLFSSLMRFAISRKREYTADAGSAEMTKNPLALASALRKISADPPSEAERKRRGAIIYTES